MAHLGLADAVNAPEALFEAVGIPREVIIDHQVSALEVDALAGGVSSQKHLHFRVVLERLLCLHAILSAHAAVDNDDRFLSAEQRSDAGFKIVQGVAVLGEKNKLLAWGWRGPGDPSGAVWFDRFSHAVGDGGRGEDLAQETRQFAPLGVRAAMTDFECKRLQTSQGLNLSFQLGDGSCRGRLIEDLFLGGLDLIVRRVFEVFDILGVQRPQGGRNDRRGQATTLEQLQFAQPTFQPLATATQRLVNRLGRRSKPPLEDG